MTAHDTAPALVKEHEAARVLGLSVKTLRRWRWAGRPPTFVKIGSAVRYDVRVLADLVESCRRASTSDSDPARKNR